VDLVKEYACLQGLVALDKTNSMQLDAIHKALKNVEAKVDPTYT